MVSAGPGQKIGDLPWVHIADPDSPELDEIARQENFHELDVEDCRHHRQIAKITEHDNYTFLVAKCLQFNPQDLTLRFEDFNVFIKPDRIVTTPEGKTDVLQKAGDRLRSVARPVPVPKLVYTLLDVIVDEYLPALYHIGEEIDEIEDVVLQDPSPRGLQRIFHLRRMLLEFRRNTILMRDLLAHFVRNQHDRQDPLYPYYHDIYEHLMRTLDLTETYRDLLTGALDIYLSSVANRTNEVMKILTIYGTVALPMVVITGVYGMNVKIPGEQGPYAFWLVLALMALSTVGVLWYFRRKRWW